MLYPRLWKEIDKASSKKLMSWIQDIWKPKISSCLHHEWQVAFKKCHLILKGILTISFISHTIYKDFFYIHLKKQNKKTPISIIIA